MKRARIAFSCLLAWCSPAAAQKLDVSEHTLSNGMKILIHEDHDVPSVAMHFYFKVGSRNERPGITGISHFFEHMMFNGAKKYGPKQFDIQMEKNGGSNNGFTTTDLTAYTDWFPPSALELMMDMEADRIRDLSFDPKIVESERGVVSSERRTSVDNSNFRLLYEQLTATAFLAHPYGWPVIGWASDIEAWSMEDLKAHYRMGYAPNNSVVVIAGDVQPAEVLRLAKKYLEPISRQEPPPAVRTKEPPQMGERRTVVRKAALLPILMAAYHMPEARHADDAAIDLLDQVLTGGRTSRLHRRLVEQEQLAVSVNAMRQPTIDPGLMVFNVQPRAGVDLRKVEEVLFEEIEKLRSAPPPDQEMDKARNQLFTRLYQELKTISGKANLLGFAEVCYGDYKRLHSREQDLAKVTPGDVQRVARQYLGEENRTVATLVPVKKEGNQP